MNVFAAYVRQVHPYNWASPRTSRCPITMMAGRWRAPPATSGANWPGGDKLRIACTGSRAVSPQSSQPMGRRTTVASPAGRRGRVDRRLPHLRAAPTTSCTVGDHSGRRGLRSGTVTPPSSAGMLCGRSTGCGCARHRLLHRRRAGLLRWGDITGLRMEANGVHPAREAAAQHEA
ncbi:hypothetical protein QJS66_02510 [Kocuria rhizophila]|nr:hypothetical protein QJS66_02510 [Kocuria rhizophila]